MTEVRIGDVVHYVSYGTPKGEFDSTCRAAIVAGNDTNATGVVELVVLNPGGLFFNTCLEDPGEPNREYHGGSWHVRCIR